MTSPRRTPEEMAADRLDLFHKGVSDDFIARVLAVMALTPHHTYQVLTKRPGRMRALLSSPDFREAVIDHVCWYDNPAEVPRVPWPLPNVHIEVARRKRAAGEARVARAESEVRAAKYALLPLLADERYAAAHPLLATLHTDEAEVDE